MREMVCGLLEADAYPASLVTFTLVMNEVTDMVASLTPVCLGRD